MPTESWAQYVRRVTHTMTQTQAAEKAGITQTAIGRWVRGETDAPRAESVVAFARSLNLPPVEALIAAGFITDDEAGQVIHVRTPITDYSDEELTAELTRRLIRNASE